MDKLTSTYFERYRTLIRGQETNKDELTSINRSSIRPQRAYNHLRLPNLGARGVSGWS